MKKILIIFIILNFMTSFAAHIKKESYYQKQWCNKWHGIMEYKLFDNTRVDCLTKTYATEFDFANKWAESIGQSLYYAQETNKKPAVVLILEKDSDMIYYNRAKKLADNYNIQLWYMKASDFSNNTTDDFESFENIIYNFAYRLVNQIFNNIIQAIFG